MTQTIDPIKLKAAAEHLDWVLRQYPDNDGVLDLLDALTPLIEEAKAGRILVPMERRDVPCTWNHGDGRYIPYNTPSVGGAFVNFSIEMGGGLTEEQKELHAFFDAMGDTPTRGSA